LTKKLIIGLRKNWTYVVFDLFRRNEAENGLMVFDLFLVAKTYENMDLRVIVVLSK